MQSCGGPLHCGETCSALLSTSTGGTAFLYSLLAQRKKMAKVHVLIFTVQSEYNSKARVPKDFISVDSKNVIYQ